MFMILQQRGKQWGLPHRTPDAGPFDTKGAAQEEIDRYFERWPDDKNHSQFTIFALTPVSD